MLVIYSDILFSVFSVFLPSDAGMIQYFRLIYIFSLFDVVSFEAASSTCLRHVSSLMCLPSSDFVNPLFIQFRFLMFIAN